MDLAIIREKDYKFPIILKNFDFALDNEGKLMKKELKREKFYV